jgi:hypothetical protein
MQMIVNSIKPNDYIRNCKDTVFTVLLKHELVKNNKEFNNLKNFSYIHGLLQYPKWDSDSDIFQFINLEHLKTIQEGKCFFIFDASTEGFSPTVDFPFFDMLYFNCKKYNINPKQVIYVSSNLQDEKNIQLYSKEKNCIPINVFSFLSFERVLTVDDHRGKEAIESNLDSIIKVCKDKFTNKLFSSLSRVNRLYRTIGTFLLCQSNIAEHALISHDKFRVHKHVLEHWLLAHGLHDVSPKQFFKWEKTLPRIVDHSDFKVNWAIHTPYRHIHDSTLFQIVNETLVLDHNETTLFYSEKTFRPIAFFQPMVIYGQPGCNHKLKELGYQLYDDWFDLSFDFEKDPVQRYKKLLESITNTVNKLKTMSKEEQIEWRFKNKDILIHNFKTMTNSTYSKTKLTSFLKDLNSQHEIN